MKTFKKIFALLTVSCILAVAFSGCISPKTYTPSDENLFTFTQLENGTYAVSAKEGAELPKTVNLPTTYNETAVTAVANNAFKGASIEEVCIPANIQVIGENAFNGCVSLTKVYFYKGVEEIQAGAFYGCSGLTELSLPSSLKVIGDAAFFGLSITRLQLTEKVESVGNNAFAYCENLASVYVAHNVSFIGENAFVGVSSEVEFEISASNAYYKLDENGYPVAR